MQPWWPMFTKLFLTLSTIIGVAGLLTLILFVTSGLQRRAFGIGQGTAIPKPSRLIDRQCRRGLARTGPPKADGGPI